MYRPTLEPDALGTSRTSHTAIEVTPLSRSGSEDLLAAWFGDSTHLFPEHLRAQILERAGGNPLYLEEVVRALLVAGVLVRDGQPADVEALDGALDEAVDPAEHQRRVAEVEVREAVHHRFVEDVALVTGLERAAEGALVQISQLPGIGAAALEALVGEIDVRLLVVEVGVLSGHGEGGAGARLTAETGLTPGS